jgi:prepilin-type N-terminal cleavage/methylation domain-containing protein
MRQARYFHSTYTTQDNHHKAFTLAEVLIVVAILGILAAIVIPRYQEHTALAKEAAAKDNLRVLRNAIELYATQHNETPPGYLDGVVTGAITFIWQLTWHSDAPGRVSQSLAPGYIYGPYLKSWPYNPYNDTWTVTMVADGQPMPGAATGITGYIYKPETKEIRLDWPGTDSAGKLFYEY